MPCQVRACAVPELFAIPRRDHRERTRHEEREGPPCVGPPADAHGIRSGDRRGERGTGRDVEEERADELDGGRPPIGAIGAIHPGVWCRSAAQAQLDEPRRREEDRADEEGQVRAHSAEPVRIPGERAQEEAHRADREPPRLPAQAQRSPVDRRGMSRGAAVVCHSPAHAAPPAARVSGGIRASAPGWASACRVHRATPSPPGCRRAGRRRGRDSARCARRSAAR